MFFKSWIHVFRIQKAGDKKKSIESSVYRYQFKPWERMVLLKDSEKSRKSWTESQYLKELSTDF